MTVLLINVHLSLSRNYKRHRSLGHREVVIEKLSGSEKLFEFRIIHEPFVACDTSCEVGEAGIDDGEVVLVDTIDFLGHVLCSLPSREVVHHFLVVPNIRDNRVVY